MRVKEGLGWKACHNEERNVYGAELVFQGSWELYEISADVFGRLNKGLNGREAGELICTGRRLYIHSNDTCGPAYNVVLDDDYAVYCQWMQDPKPVGRTWSDEMTDAAVELFESEKDNREQRRKKRAKKRE